MNTDLMLKVADHIEAHPEQYNQEVWVKSKFRQTFTVDGMKGYDAADCGTQACIAGWACFLAEPDQVAAAKAAADPQFGLIAETARALLDLAEPEAEWLFESMDIHEDIAPHETVPEFLRAIATDPTILSDKTKENA